MLCMYFPVASTRSTANASQVLKDLLDPTYYDKRLRPNFEGVPVGVSVSVHVTSIGGLDEQEMQFATTFFLRQSWKDPRLAFGDTYNARNLTLSGDIMEQIWKPDTYINNEKSSNAPPKQFLLTIFPDGTVWYSQRMTVVATCMMYLLNYPMDKQYCSISIESFGMNTDELFLFWVSPTYKDSIVIADEVTLSQFALDEYSATKILASYPTGSFTILKVTFLIRRKKFYYVVQTYIPTMLITILSWVTFWIPRNSPPARVALGITTVLALTTLIFGIQSSMPRVSYVKAIDWFLMISFLFVFSALIEYPGSRYIESHAKKITKTGTTVLRLVKGVHAFEGGANAAKSTSKEPSQLDVESAQVNEPEKLDVESTAKVSDGGEKDAKKVAAFDGVADIIADPKKDETPKKGWKRIRKMEKQKKEKIPDGEDNNIVDKYARIVFPLLYFLYNAAYWVVYLFEIDLLLR
ncbi:gamma-aminobutyric acid receptor subunit beta-1-like [Actinia tenebrosa]|uniref:Gamma-aminobutyric acid receptor subunit beta-1-like n=1 Tax=Actinia tenebrosa TaxID=6105 RepID=A0A6P8I2S6_ACTTE|nr:gamma-aminobutyric acid receptor subunit beta-1-like [Actinia tenebrosa]